MTRIAENETASATRSARVWRFGADVNTDQILPGRYSPSMTSEAELKRYPFIEARPEFPVEVRAGDIIIADNNFGCGSSREYAPRALVLSGVAAIIAPRFARIFYRNALNLGLPLFELDLPQVADGERVALDLSACTLHRETERIELPQPSDFMRSIWNAGGILPYVRAEGGLPW